ncbi:sodium-dependent dicarboxylate transporter 2/3/5 [Saccharopolyspora lacisalsi]|uniref:Sodium-dependent dicarboxylate transporter SdcS n=1 Tax=Halosaccharopolyspora lacisalsi TaxID=1000566 RepID=A0A839DZQ9_9PSEU|nr:DASS family sodium-coupled anion symporter [Halosaccharopolyspora lacisalsi]MBA8824218.1 sodium-dependent dicarboxylate transporter 2/3/5 [Halosaccharopolyspora lacisalsi]
MTNTGIPHTTTDDDAGGDDSESRTEQVRPELSRGEEKFERFRQTHGLWLAPVIAVGFALLPLPLSTDQHMLAAVLLGVITMWITEALPIPISGLLGVAAIVLLGVAPVDEVLAPFGSSTILTFVGAFILAQAMLKHGLTRRFSFAVLGIPGVGRSTPRIILAFGGITCVLSAFVSNTATVAMLLPTALGILGVISRLLRERGHPAGNIDPRHLRVGTALMLMLAYGASVGGLLTPVGAPPNLIGRALIEEATGTQITFGQWTAMALPICTVMFVVLAAVLLLLNKPEVRRISGVQEYVARERQRMGRLSRAELNTLVAFSTTVLLWITPSAFALTTGTNSTLYDVIEGRLDEGVVAIIGAGLLFILPTNWARRETTLTWQDATNIDWGTILLFGSGLIFGSLLQETGLAETIGVTASDTFGVATPFALTVFAVAMAILISETTSNTASAAVVVPIIIPLAVAAGINPLVPALAGVFAASFGFMFPVATPQNAIVYGSGAVRITQMIRCGLFFDVLGGLIIIALVPTAAALLGVAS